MQGRAGCGGAGRGCLATPSPHHHSALPALSPPLYLLPVPRWCSRPWTPTTPRRASCTRPPCCARRCPSPAPSGRRCAPRPLTLQRGLGLGPSRARRQRSTHCTASPRTDGPRTRVFYTCRPCSPLTPALHLTLLSSPLAILPQAGCQLVLPRPDAPLEADRTEVRRRSTRHAHACEGVSPNPAAPSPSCPATCASTPPPTRLRPSRTSTSSCQAPREWASWRRGSCR
jgi:hypothetical protein